MGGGVGYYKADNDVSSSSSSSSSQLLTSPHFRYLRIRLDLILGDNVRNWASQKQNRTS